MASITEVQGKNGTSYRVRFRLDNGSSRSKNFKSKEAAKRHMKIVEGNKAKGVLRDPAAGRVRFADLAWQHLNAKTDLRAASRERDERYLKLHILPRFGDVPLSKITPPDVQLWVKKLEAKGKAPRTVRECHRILAGVLADAVIEGLIVQSPCRKTKLPKVKRANKRFLEDEKVRALAQAIDPRYTALVWTLAHAGLRWGEAAGLKRVNLDLDRRLLKVDGSLERVGYDYVYTDELKTEETRRTIMISPFLTNILADHLKAAPASEYVFPAPEGGPIRYHGFRRRVWNPAVEAAGIGHVTPHELRHTCVSLLLEERFTEWEIVRYMGWKNSKMLYDTYGHTRPEATQKLADRLGERFASESVPASETRQDVVTKLPTSTVEQAV